MSSRDVVVNLVSKPTIIIKYAGHDEVKNCPHLLVTVLHNCILNGDSCLRSKFQNAVTKKKKKPNDLRVRVCLVETRMDSRAPDSLQL